MRLETFQHLNSIFLLPSIILCVDRDYLAIDIIYLKFGISWIIKDKI